VTLSKDQNVAEGFGDWLELLLLIVSGQEIKGNPVTDSQRQLF
jgi:hypothetical protein